MTTEKPSGDAEQDKGKPTPSTPGSDTNAPSPGEKAPAKELTKEEQMALYEEDLKENDWGHQPC